MVLQAFDDVLAWLEDNHALGRHLDNLVGLWIAGFSGSSLFNLEYAEVSQLQTTFHLQYLDYTVKAPLNDLLSEGLVYPQLNCYLSNYFFFGQCVDSLREFQLFNVLEYWNLMPAYRYGQVKKVCNIL